MTGRDIHAALHVFEARAMELAVDVIGLAAEIRARLMIMQEIVDAGSDEWNEARR